MGLRREGPPPAVRSLVKGAAHRTSLKHGGPSRKAQAFLRPHMVKRVSDQQPDITETVFRDTVEKPPCKVLNRESSRTSGVRRGQATPGATGVKLCWTPAEREFQPRDTGSTHNLGGFLGFPCKINISQGRWNCREFNSWD